MRRRHHHRRRQALRHRVPAQRPEPSTLIPVPIPIPIQPARRAHRRAWPTGPHSGGAIDRTGGLIRSAGAAASVFADSGPGRRRPHGSELAMMQAARGSEIEQTMACLSYGMPGNEDAGVSPQLTGRGAPAAGYACLEEKEDTCDRVRYTPPGGCRHGPRIRHARRLAREEREAMRRRFDRVRSRASMGPDRAGDGTNAASRGGPRGGPRAGGREADRTHGAIRYGRGRRPYNQPDRNAGRGDTWRGH